MSEISYIFQYHYDKDIDVNQVHENISWSNLMRRLKDDSSGNFDAKDAPCGVSLC